MYNRTVKILLLGDSAAGKSAILQSYCGQEFSPNFMPTIGIDFKVKTYFRKGENIKVQIWDTAGQERFHAITAAYYRGASGVILVYDITDNDSFKNIRKWLENVRDIPKVLIGNKIDLFEKRKVQVQMGEELARELGIPFYEVSAKTGEGVKNAFDTLVDLCKREEIFEPRNVVTKTSQSKCCQLS